MTAQRAGTGRLRRGDEALAEDAGGAGPVDLVVACGDLPFDYLATLMAGLDAPLAFVAGNHDPDISGYRVSRNGLVLRAGLPAEPPWPAGAMNADGHVVDVAGLRIAGLGGCVRYSDGPNQYTPRQQRRRARRLIIRARWLRFRDGRGVDVVLTHAPPLGVGDGNDGVHRGFAAHLDLMARLRPLLLLHGHVPVRTGELRWDGTAVRNVVGRRVLEIEPNDAARNHAS